MGKWKFYNHKFEYRNDYDDLDTPWAGHTFFAYDLVRNINPGVIVELGTHKGTSFYSILEALKDIRSESNAYAVDSWEGDEHTGTRATGYNPDEVYEFVAHIVRKFYPEQNAHLVRKYFNEAAKDFGNETINLLHMDVLHTYEAVKEDFNTWYPKLASNSVVLFHDIGVADFGVNEVWQEAKKSFDYTFEFKHSHGLGVAVKGKEYTQVLQEATTCPDLFRDNYRTLFMLNSAENAQRLLHIRLGEIPKISSDLKNLAEENSILKRQKSALEKKLKDTEKVYTNAYTQLTQLTSRKIIKVYRKIVRMLGRDI